MYINFTLPGVTQVQSFGMAKNERHGIEGCSIHTVKFILLTMW